MYLCFAAHVRCGCSLGCEISHLSSLSHYQIAFNAEGGDTSESETYCTTTTTTVRKLIASR